MRRQFAIALLLALTALTPRALCAASDMDQLVAERVPWWSKAWPYRARLRIDAIPPEWLRGRPAVDTGILQGFSLHGRSLPDGSDLRIVDDAGQPVNFRIVWHDPQENTVLQIQVPPGENFRAWLYYGYRDAFPIDTDHADDFAEPWEPRVMVTERVWRKPYHKHPQTLAELKKMIAEAGKPEGVHIWNRIEHGYNRFGESDHYMTEFDGYMYIDREGDHEFRIYANDAGWLVIDGEEKISWPGPREKDEDQFNMDSRAVNLNMTPGLHRIQFYHEEGEGNQVAFLRWKAPGMPHLDNVTKAQWAYQRSVRVEFVQAVDRPLVARMNPRIRHSYWIPDTESQINWIAVRDESIDLAGKVVHRRFELDDGAVYEADGDDTEVEHVFFSCGTRKITMTVTDDKGNSDAVTHDMRTWPVNVELRYEVGPERDPNRAVLGMRGSLPMYERYLDLFKELPPYDVTKLTVDDLVNYVRFWSTFENDEKTLAGLAELLRRQPDHPAIAEMGERGLRAALRSGIGLDMAQQFLSAREQAAKEPLERAQVAMQRAYIMTWGTNKYDQAEEIVKKVRKELPEGLDAGDIRRRTWLLAGDIAVLRGDMGEARHAYEEAETPETRAMSKSAKLVRVGSYPFAVGDYLSRSCYEEALDAIDEWESTLPVVKLEGMTFFLRGKTLFLMKPSDLALKYLQASTVVSPGAVHVPEANWLIANCLMAMERYREAAAEFVRLRASLSTMKYRQRAIDKIKECAAHLDGEIEVIE